MSRTPFSGLVEYIARDYEDVKAKMLSAYDSHSWDVMKLARGFPGRDTGFKEEDKRHPCGVIQRHRPSQEGCWTVHRAKGEHMDKRATDAEKRGWIAREAAFKEKADYVLSTHDVTKAELSEIWLELVNLQREGQATYGLIERARKLESGYRERMNSLIRKMDLEPYFFYERLSEKRKEEWHSQLGGKAAFREYAYSTDIGCLVISVKGTGARIGICNGFGDGTFPLKVFDSSEDFERRFVSKPYYWSTPLVLWVDDEATVAVDGEESCVLGLGRWTAYTVKSGSGKMCLVREDMYRHPAAD